MHPNPAFRQTPEAERLAFARARGFGMLAVSGVDGAGLDGPLLAHVPFLIAEDGASVELHLVRSNPVLAALPAPAVLAAMGPEAYVSPDWYGVPDQVPTWNYVAVHLRGRLVTLPEHTLEPMLDRLSAAFEARLAPKRPWTSAKMTDGVMARMMRAIVPCRLEITSTEGTWKLSQNKPAEVRLRAAENLPPALGALMRDA